MCTYFIFYFYFPQVIRHYHGHLSAVHALDLHPTIDILLTCGRDSSARVRNRTFFFFTVAELHSRQEVMWLLSVSLHYLVIIVLQNITRTYKFQSSVCLSEIPNLWNMQ